MEALQTDDLQRQSEKMDRKKERDLEKRRLKRKAESEMKKQSGDMNNDQPVFKKPFLVKKKRKDLKIFGTSFHLILFLETSCCISRTSIQR